MEFRGIPWRFFTRASPLGEFQLASYFLSPFGICNILLLSLEWEQNVEERKGQTCVEVEIKVE